MYSDRIVARSCNELKGSFKGVIGCSYVYPHPHKTYPSDVSDDEWEFVAPYLTLMTPEALQRTYELREVFNAVRGWPVREHPGATCPATSHLGRGVPTSPPLDGSRQL